MTSNESSLNALVYISTIDTDLPIEQAREIISRRREVNRSLEVTGVLICSGGNIFRLIEGEKSIVQEVYKNAKLEPQYHVLKLYSGPIEHRFFSDYPLAVKVVNGDLKPLDDFQKPEMKEYWNELLQMDGPITNLIKDFIRNNS